MVRVELSDEAFALVCGLVQPTKAVDRSVVDAPRNTWDEARACFPFAAFQIGVETGVVEYLPDTEDEDYT